MQERVPVEETTSHVCLKEAYAYAILNDLLETIAHVQPRNQQPDVVYGYTMLMGEIKDLIGGYLAALEESMNEHAVPPAKEAV